MKHIRAGIVKLERQMKPKLEEEEKKKQRERKKKELFDFANLVMQEYYPEHDWNKLPLEERWWLWDKPDSLSRHLGKSGVFVPSEEPEDKLVIEVLDLLIKVLREEEARRANEEHKAEN